MQLGNYTKVAKTSNYYQLLFTLSSYKKYLLSYYFLSLILAIVFPFNIKTNIYTFQFNNITLSISSIMIYFCSILFLFPLVDYIVINKFNLSHKKLFTLRRIFALHTYSLCILIIPFLIGTLLHSLSNFLLFSVSIGISFYTIFRMFLYYRIFLYYIFLYVTIFI